MKRHANPTHHTESQERERAEKQWIAFLNGLGFLAFPLGLACLTTKTPAINGALSFAFLALVYGTGRHLMPAHYPQQQGGHASGISGIPFTHEDRLRLWKKTTPALFGYLYLCLITFSHLIEWYCVNSAHECKFVSNVLQAYVGAPGT